MRALVTGATGFLGSELVDRLMLAGYEVMGIGRAGLYRVNELAQLKFQDLSNLDGVSSIISDFRPELVVHCAGMASTPRCIEDPIGCWRDNFQSGLNILEASRRIGVQRVVLASSNVVYGSDNPYRAAKLALEGAAQSYSDTYGLSTFCLRYGNLYGESGRKGFIAAAISAWETGETLRVNGLLSGSRNWVHVTDAAEATIQAALCIGFRGWADVATNQEVSLGEIIKCLPGLKVELSADPQPGDVPHLHQGHSNLLSKWTDVKEWLCAQSS